jgi:hypothetical protein
MHIAGANGTDVLLALPFPNRENQKNVAARWRLSNRLEPAFRRGTRGLDHNGSKKKGFNFFRRDAVLLAFAAIPFIPIERRCQFSG